MLILSGELQWPSKMPTLDGLPTASHRLPYPLRLTAQPCAHTPLSPPCQNQNGSLAHGDPNPAWQFLCS